MRQDAAKTSRGRPQLLFSASLYESKILMKSEMRFVDEARWTRGRIKRRCSGSPGTPGSAGARDSAYNPYHEKLALPFDTPIVHTDSCFGGRARRGV